MTLRDFFRPKWKKNSDGTVGLAAVRKINDQTLLAEIAKTDSDDHVRKEAVKKLRDQALLAEIAKTSPSWSGVRKEAFSRLTDQALAEVANTTSD